MAKECTYQTAMALMDKASYQEADSAFQALGDYKDSAAKAKECGYQTAIALIDKGSYAPIKSRLS